MVYGDGLVVILGEGDGLKISYVIAGPVHTGVLHAPPCPLPWSAIGKVEIGKCTAANDQHDRDQDHDYVFLHSCAPPFSYVKIFSIIPYLDELSIESEHFKVFFYFFIFTPIFTPISSGK